MDQYLFVYGTLMAGLDSGPGQLLAKQASFLGEGWINGHLYDLGRYPGLVYDQNTVAVVRGHIFHLNSPNQMLPLLDQYEGYDERHTAQSEYVRKRCPVKHRDGEELICQVYIYQGTIADKILIDSGDYLDYVSKNEQHQNFIHSTKSK